MIAQLIAIGVFSSASGGSGPITDVGAVVASAERTAVIPVVQSTALRSTGLPLGAVPWDQQYDPADHAPFVLDFTALLETAEKIVGIDAIAMNATAALLGVGVDGNDPWAPIISLDGKKVQLWFTVDLANWEAVSFAVNGVLLPVTVRVLTDAAAPKRYERTGILTVRQL